MKNKLFKAVKSMLSIAVAFAVILVSLFAALPAINLKASAATVEDTWDGTKVKPTKTDASGNILIENAEQLAWIALEASPEETKDKNYKVVDNAVFNLNGMTDVTLDTTAGEVSGATATGNNWAGTKKTFAGNFDGNGVVIYNMYAPGSGYGAYGGLFPWLNTDNSTNTSNFSDVTIKASYVKGYHAAAALIGNVEMAGSGRYININNVKAENCYINSVDSNAVCSRTAAILVAHAAHAKVTVDGCIAIDNIVAATDIKGGFVGNSSAYAGSSVVKNSVLVGSTPYPVLQAGSTKVLQSLVSAASCYSNVYTDQDVASAYAGYVTKVAASDMKGAAAKVNMPSLDWSKLIAFDGEYPDLRVSHVLTTTSNGDSGHSTSCSDCGKAFTETHNMVENFDTMVSSCACGYETPITQMKDTWDGTQATSFAGGTGTKDDPYIIKTAEQMAYVALSTTLDSKGKYFKVTDNAVFNMNGAIGITLNSTAAEVKAAPKSGAYKWTSDGAKFNGNFDGNGVIIYNVYGPKMGYGGLFPNINTDNAEKSVTIKNVAVKASSFAGYHCTGGIVGNATAATTTQELNFENCMVENCYMTDMGDTNPACERVAGTIAGRVAHNKVTVDNCLAKGNLLEAINIVGGFVGNTSHFAPNAVIKNSVSLGTLPYPTQNAGSTVTLEAMISSAECYTNVYTDMALAAAYNGSKIKTFTTEQMSGKNCLDNVALDYAKIWFANEGTPELQIFHSLKGTADATDAYSGHKADCEECGIKGVAVSAHTYDDAYKCTTCEFVCDHKNSDYKTVKDDAGDCVTAPYTRTECECGYIHTEYHGTATGHKLVKTDAKEVTCIKDGNIEYWTCEKCEKVFLTDDKMAAMDTAVELEETILKATKKHLPIVDSNGVAIYGMDAQKHWQICKYCNCELNKTSHDVEYSDNNASGHSGKCTVCLYEVHDFVDLNSNGKPIQAYDEFAHWYNCEDCGQIEYEGHTMETKKCDEGIYHWCEDAEGNSCGYETFDYFVEGENGIVAAMSRNAFSKDVITDIFALGESNSIYEKVKGIFDKAGYQKFSAYDFSPTEEVADGGKVELSFMVEGTYGKNAAIYFVDTENGKLEKLDTKIVEVTNDKGVLEHYKAIVIVNKIGVYAVAANEVIGGGVGDDYNNNDFSGGDNLGGTDYNENVGGDTSSTSPATKTQGVAPIAVMAVLSAAILVASKAKKA